MAEQEKNRFGLTEEQLGEYGTDEKPAKFPKRDVLGRDYQRGSVSMIPLTKATFAVVPAGLDWTAERAAEAFKADWDKQQKAKEAERTDVQEAPSVDAVDNVAEASGKELTNEPRTDVKRTGR